MRKNPTFCFLLAFSYIWLAGCSLMPANKNYADFKSIESIKAGKSKQEDVEKIFGPPTEVSANGNETILRYEDKKTDMEMLTIGTSNDTKTVEWLMVDTSAITETPTLSWLFKKYPNLHVAPNAVEQENPHSWNPEEYYRDDEVKHQFAVFNSAKDRVVTIGWYNPAIRQTAGSSVKKTKRFTIGER
jgi:hypothetical protein